VFLTNVNNQTKKYFRTSSRVKS